MKRVLLVTGALALAPTAAMAQDPSGGFGIGGKLSKQDARAFIHRTLPPSAPKLLLRDKRQYFFSTQWVRVNQTCDRLDKSQVQCGFKLRLKPDKKHRKANWWSINCRGSVHVAHLSNGGIGGDVGAYVCKTVRPKK